MSTEAESDDQITNRIIKASFSSAGPEILARVKAIAEATELPTDPKVIADDTQTVAVLALQNAENIDTLIQILRKLGETGSLQATRREKPPKRGRL